MSAARIRSSSLSRAMLALALIVLSSGISDMPTAWAQRGHMPDCSTLEGIRKARCERHEKMYDKCHAIRGEAHHECDRVFLIVNPLDCAVLSERDAALCTAEGDAVAACKDQTGRAFFKCAAERLRTDPRH